MCYYDEEKLGLNSSGGTSNNIFFSKQITTAAAAATQHNKLKQQQQHLMAGIDKTQSEHNTPTFKHREPPLPNTQ